VSAVPAQPQSERNLILAIRSGSSHLVSHILTYFSADLDISRPRRLSLLEFGRVCSDSKLDQSRVISTKPDPSRPKSHFLRELRRKLRRKLCREIVGDESKLVWSTAAQHRQNKANQAKQSQIKESTHLATSRSIPHYPHASCLYNRVGLMPNGRVY